MIFLYEEIGNEVVLEISGSRGRDIDRVVQVTKDDLKKTLALLTT